MARLRPLKVIRYKPFSQAFQRDSERFMEQGYRLVVDYRRDRWIVYIYPHP